MHQNTKTNIHIPVLLTEVMDALNPKLGESYLDLTASFGGHARAVMSKTKSPTNTWLVDRDAEATLHLHSDKDLKGVTIINSDFLSASQKLADEGRKFDMILADLGVSSLHLNSAKRGFSIKHDGPLDMRMDQSQPATAGEIVNSYSEKRLAQIIRDYGEDPKAKQIASMIIMNRPIRSTHELAEIVKSAWKGRSRVHPATKTFQALRIALNEELDQLTKALPLWLDLLSEGGRLAIISFHSLEDRIVKQCLKQELESGWEAHLVALTKKPVVPSDKELVFNPRARSAKLRAVAKIKTERRVNANTGQKSLQDLQGAR